MNSNLAIIVLNYFNYNLTKKCIDNLITLGVEDHIIVVDNNSPNDSYEILKEKYQLQDNIYIIKNSINNGYSGGNNFGVKYILDFLPDVKYICIINPDVLIYYKEVFSNLINKIKNRKEIAIISPVQIFNSTYDTSFVCWNIPKSKDIIVDPSIFLHRFFHRTKSIHLNDIDSSLAIVEVVSGSFFIIKKDIFVSLGLFDENTFLYNEENILAIKIKNKGYKEAVSINDYFYHNHSHKDLSLINKYKICWAAFESKLYLCKKYYSWILIPFLFLVQILVFMETLLFHLNGKRKKIMTKS